MFQAVRWIKARLQQHTNTLHQYQMLEEEMLLYLQATWETNLVFLKDIHIQNDENVFFWFIYLIFIYFYKIKKKKRNKKLTSL